MTRLNFIKNIQNNFSAQKDCALVFLLCIIKMKQDGK